GRLHRVPAHEAEHAREAARQPPLPLPASGRPRAPSQPGPPARAAHARTLAGGLSEMQPPLRVLGIDPGSHHTGWGVVERRGTSLVLVACGTISPKGSLPLATRLAEIAAGVREVCERERPDAVSVEKVFQSVNARAALVLGQARGAAFAATGGALPVHE